MSKDFTNDEIKIIRLNGSVYDFSFYYGTIDTKDILSIHKYLIKKAIFNKMNLRIFKPVKLFTEKFMYI